MLNAKKPGITNAIRDKLGFSDEALWRRFSARRLELIDALDLSSHKASDQEENVKSVARVLRQEFHYGPETLEDFEALVRAAVQSVRRNRKRGQKTRPAVKKAKPNALVNNDTARSQFLMEIAHIADTQDTVYDMSYSTNTVITNQDRSRAAIDTIIRPYEGPLNTRATGSGAEELAGHAHESAERELKLHSLRLTLLLLMKRSKLCLHVTMLAKNDLFRAIGQSALSSVCMLMLERSFGGINRTSLEHIREKITSTGFQAKFYRSLEPSSTAYSSLDDDTAATTLHTLMGCCIRDFGYDFVLQHMGEAFYHCILLEYPFVASASVPFCQTEPLPWAFQKSPNEPGKSRETEPQGESLEARLSSESAPLEGNLAGASGALKAALKRSEEFSGREFAEETKELTNGNPRETPENRHHGTQKETLRKALDCAQEQTLAPEKGSFCPSGDCADGKQELLGGDQEAAQKPGRKSQEYGSLEKLATIASKLEPSPGAGTSRQPRSPTHTKVTLRFLSSALNFTFPVATSAPPRYNEVLENARAAFRLPKAQNYALRNHTSGAAITDDFELERLFSSHHQVDLEVYALRGSRVPLRDSGPAPGPAIPKPESPRSFPSPSCLQPPHVGSKEHTLIVPAPELSGGLNAADPGVPKFQPLL